MKTAVQLAESPEVKAAVDWWCQRLAGANKQDSGDAKLNLEIGLLRSMDQDKNRFPSMAALARFRLSLTVMLAIRLSEFWNEENPNYGSACRTLGVDYGPDYTIHSALAAANIEHGDMILPIKTTMWIGPGYVKVGCGYRGSIVFIYGSETVRS